MIVHYQQSYAIQLLSYICYKHNLDTALSVAEACGVLGITPRQLEEAGAHSSYEQVMQAVSDFEKGNLRLSTVLTALEHERNG